MTPVYIILGALAFLLAVYLFLIAPGKKMGVSEYKTTLFAHRGLHNGERAENSMSAFRAAVDGGYGIELDIRLSRDGELVVFHDDTLTRVVGIEGRVDEYTADELAKMSLSGTGDGIPRFSEVLSLVDGKVPLLVEIKEDAGKYGVSDAAVKLLSGYSGRYIVESFNPLSIRNFKKQKPGIPVGILSHNYYKEEKYRKPLYLALRLMLLNVLARPAFIAYCHSDYRSVSFRVAKRLFGAVTFAWTVRSAEEERAARAHGFDSVIFENYIPD